MDWGTAKCGILQGSVLGPLLFNICINDFPKIINKHSDTILFADYTSVLVTSTNYIDLNLKLHSILHHTLNSSKHIDWYKYIIKFISTKAPIFPLNITHIYQTHAIIETIKFLGMDLDSHLSWKSVLWKKLKFCMFHDENIIPHDKHR